MDTFFKFLEKFIQQIEKVFESILSISFLSNDLVLPLLLILLATLLIFALIIIKRKKLNKRSITEKNKPIAKKEKARDKKFTFQFKKAVFGLDLNLTSDENKEQNNMTASQKRELTLNLNALKELLDGDYISKEQHDVKEKELKAIYD
jgi:ABC-type transport system involved in cytochrome bd biosynthesis fused ATPase/permease subunit